MPATQTALNKPLRTTIAQTLFYHRGTWQRARSMADAQCFRMDLSVRDWDSGHFCPKPRSAPSSPRPRPLPPSASAPCVLWSPSGPSRSPSSLLHPVPLPRTPPSPSCFPHPPLSSCRLRTLFPRSPPQLRTPPRPSRTDFAGPGVSACSGGGEERGQRGQEPGCTGHDGRRQG